MKRQVLVQAKAAAILKPEATPRYIEDFKIARTRGFTPKDAFSMGMLKIIYFLAERMHPVVFEHILGFFNLIHTQNHNSLIVVSAQVGV
jgi:hypothetical protein